MSFLQKLKNFFQSSFGFQKYASRSEVIEVTEEELMLLLLFSMDNMSKYKVLGDDKSLLDRVSPFLQGNEAQGVVYRQIGPSATSKATNSPSNSENYSYMDIINLRQNLDFGMRLFHEGKRSESLPYLTKVLDDPKNLPSFKLAASGMIAETYRGLGNFEKAEQMYELSINISDSIPPAQRSGNEWYQHYRPRASMGLLTVLRRNLSNDHNQFNQLLLETRNQFSNIAGTDFMAQLNLIEGLYLRQMGDVDASIQRLKEGIEDLQEVDPPYSFLWPEHFEALLILSYVCTPRYMILAGRHARKMLRSQIGPWSQAVSALALSKMSLERLFPYIPIDPNDESTKEELGKIRSWTKIALEYSRFERDPLLISEAYMQKIIIGVVENQRSLVEQDITSLMNSIEHAIKPTQLLRAIEMASIRQELNALGFDAKTNEVLSSINSLGKEAYQDLFEDLKSYNCREELLEYWQGLLYTETNNSPLPPFSKWVSNEINELRLRIWP